MSTPGDGGKGSERRPGQGYQDGWDRIFGRQPKSCPPCNNDCYQGRYCPARAGEPYLKPPGDKDQSQN